MGGITRLKGMGMFMDVMGLGPAPIMPIWSWVWKYMLDERPVEELKGVAFHSPLFSNNNKSEKSPFFFFFCLPCSLDTVRKKKKPD